MVLGGFRSFHVLVTATFGAPGLLSLPLGHVEHTKRDVENILLNPFPYNFRQRYLYKVDRAVLNMNSKIFFRRITGVWTVKSQRKPNFKADTV